MTWTRTTQPVYPLLGTVTRSWRLLLGWVEDVLCVVSGEGPSCNVTNHSDHVPTRATSQSSPDNTTPIIHSLDTHPSAPHVPTTPLSVCVKNVFSVLFRDMYIKAYMGNIKYFQDIGTTVIPLS